LNAAPTAGCASRTRPYDSANIPPVTIANTIAGLDYRAFEGSFPWVPDFTLLTAAASGSCAGIDGIDDIVTIATYTPPLGSTPRTFTAWLKPAATQPELSAWLGYGTNTSGNRISKLDSLKLRRHDGSGLNLKEKILTEGNRDNGGASHSSVHDPFKARMNRSKRRH
jgi:hypothetical protein